MLLPFIIGVCFTDWILKNLRKILYNINDFWSSKIKTWKQIRFFKLTNYKQIFLKVRSNYSKNLENYQIAQSTLYSIVFTSKYAVSILINFFIFYDKWWCKSLTICLFSKKMGNYAHFHEIFSFIDRCVNKYFR